MARRYPQRNRAALARSVKGKTSTKVNVVDPGSNKSGKRKKKEVCLVKEKKQNLPSDDETSQESIGSSGEHSASVPDITLATDDATRRQRRRVTTKSYKEMPEQRDEESDNSSDGSDWGETAGSKIATQKHPKKSCLKKRNDDHCYQKTTRNNEVAEHQEPHIVANNKLGRRRRNDIQVFADWRDHSAVDY